jgi:hypothetical protein
MLFVAGGWLACRIMIRINSSALLKQQKLKKRVKQYLLTPSFRMGEESQESNGL